MKKAFLTFLTLALASLACGQYVTPTAIPNALGTPVPVMPSVLTPASPPTQTAQIPTATPAPGTAIVTAGEALHVRALPGETEEVIGYLYAGDSVVLTNKCSDDPTGWAQIEWNDATAWVRASYLSKNECEVTR